MKQQPKFKKIVAISRDRQTGLDRFGIIGSYRFFPIRFGTDTIRSNTVKIVHPFDTIQNS
jgi:hypothetical protein